MTNEGALKILKEVWYRTGILAGESKKSAIEAYVAVEALEKQIPKKPILIEDKRYLCANCESTVRFKLDLMAYPMNEHKHCIFCGQALDWSEYEKK